MKKKKLNILLEFGIPPYREFLFKYINSITDEFKVIHNGEKFTKDNYDFDSIKCDSISFYKFKFYLQINRYLRNTEVIISSFNFWRPSCWMPLFFSKNREIILWGHIQGSNENFFSKFFKKACIKRAKYVLAYTENGKSYAVNKLGIKDEKILVVHNTLFVSNSKLSTCIKKYFLYVGRIQERKGLSLFIKSLKDIKYSGELLRIVGDGEYKSELIELVNSLNLNDKVKFHSGTFDDNILMKHFENAITYVSPSHVGLGVVHSFAYGIPVLCDNGANHAPEFEYCNNQNSFLYNGENELLPVINKILSDSNLSFIKGEKAYEYYVKNLSPAVMENVFFKAIYN